MQTNNCLPACLSLRSCLALARAPPRIVTPSYSTSLRHTPGPAPFLQRQWPALLHKLQLSMHHMGTSRLPAHWTWEGRVAGH